MALRHALLTLLADEDLSGYDLVQYFDGSMGFVWHATHPQIYRELEKMRSEKLVSGRFIRQVGRPNKTVYSITAKGRHELLEWAASPAPPRLVKDGAFLRAFSYGRIDPTVARTRLREDESADAERLSQYRKLFDVVSTQPDDPRRTGAVLTLKAGIFITEAYHRWSQWARAYLEENERRPRRGRTARREESSDSATREIMQAGTVTRRAQRRG